MQILVKGFCAVVLPAISIANAAATQIEYGYLATVHNGYKAPFPNDFRYMGTNICDAVTCYTGIGTQQVYSDQVTTCNAVLSYRNSDGLSHFWNYRDYVPGATNNDFSLVSVGAPFTDHLGYSYDENQCILYSHSARNRLLYGEFTTNNQNGIAAGFGYPSIRTLPVARCAGHATWGDYWFPRKAIGMVCPIAAAAITLTPAPNQSPPDPRPKGTEGKDPKSHELIAKVMEGSTPKAGVAVTFKVDVKEGSGEHSVTSNGDHVHANRPKGKITPLTEKTNTSGEIRIKFESADPAGTHIVTATCETCSNKSATKDVKVLVPDLVELTADKGTPKTFNLVGNTNYPGTNHPGNHYFTAAAKETLVNGVIPTMIEAGWGVVGVNDGSLKDGGLFDINGNWTTSHAGHRIGTEVDISFKQPKGVGDKTVREAYKELCKKDGAAFDIQTLWHKNDGYEPHYHIYLNGLGLPSGSKEKCCERNRTPKKDKEGNIVLHTSGKNKGQPVYLYFCEEKPLAQ